MKPVIKTDVVVRAANPVEVQLSTCVFCGVRVKWVEVLHHTGTSAKGTPVDYTTSRGRCWKHKESKF